MMREPNPYGTTTLLITLTRDTKSAIKQISTYYGASMSEIVNDALSKYIQSKIPEIQKSFETAEE